MRRIPVTLLALVLLSAPCLAAVVFEDDFSAGDLADSPAWVPIKGEFQVVDGALALPTEAGSAIHLSLGQLEPRSPVKVGFTLRQSNGTGASHLLSLSLGHSALGRQYVLRASPNVAYFGGGDKSSGFYDGKTTGHPGTHLNATVEPQRLELLLDPEADSLRLLKDGAEVFATANYLRLATTDGLTIETGGALSWFIDDVSVEATPRGEPKPAQQACQSRYLGGVPHTDARGRRRLSYDPEQSFFQIGIWGNPIGEIWGTDYDPAILTAAGFNTMWPWPSKKLPDALQVGARQRLQVVQMGPIDLEVLARVKDHPNLLGNVWHDEPTGSFWGKDMEGKFAEFLTYKADANAIAPDMPVFINDVPWITPPATDWWLKWNTAGDVSCHDNYPIAHAAQTKTIGAIADTVSLATEANDESKPVWLIVGAFEQPGIGGITFRFPTAMQLRACVYAGLIHGATGIIYFAWDTYVCRDGNVIGMAPDPRVAYVPNPREEGYTHPTPATGMQLVAARALWDAATRINGELGELRPALLAPTVPASELAYTVATTVGRSPAPVHCLLKPAPDGGFTLLTVNLEDTLIEARFLFDRPVAEVTPLYEGKQAIPMLEGKTGFEAVYEPFEVHVYHIAL